eukprot:1159747-Pelagomonas_calceolata.AAC.2
MACVNSRSPWRRPACKPTARVISELLERQALHPTQAHLEVEFMASYVAAGAEHSVSKSSKPADMGHQKRMRKELMD